MKNKSVRKRTTSAAHRTQSSSERTVVWYTVIIFSLILMVFTNVGYKLSKPHVLGISTTLAESGNPGETAAPGSTTGLTGSEMNTSGDSGISESGNSGLLPLPISANVTVDCVGPDGKHFVTEFENCRDLNQNWGHTRFSFTPLSNSLSQGSETTGSSQITLPTNTEKLKQYVTFHTEEKKRPVNLTTKGLHVEFTKEDNGTISAVAKPEHGNDIALFPDDAITKLNDQLKAQDVEISSTEGGLVFRKGSVEAQTHFPISVDSTTGQLTVTTPSGTKDVAVLPDKAVQNLLATGVFSGVSTQSSTTSAGATEQTVLTDVNGIPAYQVQGVLSKKLLGLFPVSFSKTAFVSAQDGHTINVQQSTLTSFLEALSF
ncbi:MAG: hypothetical protein KGJ07_03920 [Patescibacteria group bacterium]|nr:hypothetical protein [Patescibacteria group bacterium]MDE2590440.1 hypothetical protein [Patescibacteria group bacterium]